MLQEIATLICAQTGLVLGTNLYAGHWPQDKPDQCVMVGESGGGEPNFYCPDMANLNIQILNRSKTYFTGRSDAYSVYWAMHGSAGWNMPRLDGLSGEDYLAWAVEAISLPASLGQDSNGRFLFSTNFIFRMEEASCGI